MSCRGWRDRERGERGVSQRTREGKEGFQKEAIMGGLGPTEARQAQGSVLVREPLWCRPMQHGVWHLPGPSRYSTGSHFTEGRPGGLGVGRGMPSPLSSLGLGRASSAPCTRPLQPQRGSVCESNDGRPMPSSVLLVAGLRTPLRGAQGGCSVSCRGQCWAFAETQCHLVAGGAHTRFLPDCHAPR